MLTHHSRVGGLRKAHACEKGMPLGILGESTVVMHLFLKIWGFNLGQELFLKYVLPYRPGSINVIPCLQFP